MNKNLECSSGDTTKNIIIILSLMIISHILYKINNSSYLSVFHPEIIGSSSIWINQEYRSMASFITLVSKFLIKIMA